MQSYSTTLNASVGSCRSYVIAAKPPLSPSFERAVTLLTRVIALRAANVVGFAFLCIVWAVVFEVALR